MTRFSCASEARRRARIYGLVHRGNPGDAAFYRAEAAGARRVLELGCGTGRLLAALAADGLTVTGLDIDPAKLAEAERGLAHEDRAARARVTLVAGDMRAFALAERFDRVLIPYNGLYTLASDDEVVACLACAHAHLAPGGRVAFDGYTVDPEDVDVEDPDDPFEYVVSVVDDGLGIDVYSREEPAPTARSFLMAYRYVVRGAKPEELGERIAHHYLMPADLDALLARAGLARAALWGDFRRSPFDPRASEHMVVVAAAPEDDRAPRPLVVGEASRG